MVAKRKSSKGIFAPGDGRRRGSGHAGWLKMPTKSKYIRGEASKKISKTGASILRDHAKSKGTTIQLRPRGTSMRPELTTTYDNEANSTDFSMPEKFVTYLTWPTTSTH